MKPKFFVFATSVDSQGVKLHRAIGEFDDYSEAQALCLRHTAKLKDVEVYVLQFDDTYPVNKIRDRLRTFLNAL